jgi:hypothetical protein
MAENQSPGLLSLSSVEAYWYGSRLRSFFSRTLNQGLGPFFLFSLFLVAFFLDARIVLKTADEDRAYVQNLIEVQTPLASPDQHAAILSLLLIGLNSPKFPGALYCPDTDQKGACLVGTDLANRTQALVSHLMEKGSLEDATMFGFDAKPYGSSLRKNMEDRATDLPSSLEAILRTPRDDRCMFDEKHAQRTSVFMLAQPQCENLHSISSTGLIPQQAADALVQRSDNKPANAQVSLRDYRVRRAVLDSQLFDVALRSLRPDIEGARNAARDKLLPSIAAAYFITVDSVIRYSNFQQPSLNADLPPYKLWAAREYIEKIIDKVETQRDVTTKAYIDFAGSGIVYTRCRAILAASNDPIVPPGGVVGAVCIDYSLSDAGISALTHIVDGGAVTRAVSLRVHRSTNEAKWAFSEPGPAPRWAAGATVQRQLDDFVSSLATDPSTHHDILTLPPASTDQPVEKLSAPSPARGFAKAGEIRPFFRSRENIFFVPTGIDHSGDTMAILLAVNGIGPFGSRPWPTFLAVVFAGLAIGALVAGASTSKELSEREGILSRLRSLQMAVIQTDSDDRITAANDRAEDLTGQTLPVFGLRPNSGAKTFWQLFDQRTICMTPEMSHLSPSPTVLDASTLEKGSIHEIKEARQAGKTTSYFVRLRMQRLNVINDACADQWLRITAGPIFQPGRILGAQDVSSTFGTIDTVPREYAEILDRFCWLKAE